MWLLLDTTEIDWMGKTQSTFQTNDLQVNFWTTICSKTGSHLYKCCHVAALFLGKKLILGSPNVTWDLDPSPSPWKADYLHRNGSCIMSLFDLASLQFHGPFLQITLPTLGWSLFWPLRILMRRWLTGLEPSPSSWDIKWLHEAQVFLISRVTLWILI